MIGELLYGWVATLKGEPVPDVWETDPRILAERERQHEQGVVDSAQVTHLRAEVERRKRQREQQ